MNEYIKNLYGFVASDIIDDYLKRGVKDIKSSTEFNSYSYSDYTKKYIPLIVDIDILTSGNKSNVYLKEIESYEEALKNPYFGRVLVILDLNIIIICVNSCVYIQNIRIKLY